MKLTVNNRSKSAERIWSQENDHGGKVSEKRSRLYIQKRTLNRWLCTSLMVVFWLIVREIPLWEKRENKPTHLHISSYQPAKEFFWVAHKRSFLSCLTSYIFAPILCSISQSNFYSYFWMMCRIKERLWATLIPRDSTENCNSDADIPIFQRMCCLKMPASLHGGL